MGLVSSGDLPFQRFPLLARRFKPPRNQAYKYSSVAFLQFCKQGNVALMFFMMLGKQDLRFIDHGSMVLQTATMQASKGNGFYSSLVPL